MNIINTLGNLFKRGPATPTTFIQVMDEFINRLKIEGNLKASTAIKHRGLRINIIDFLEHTGRKGLNLSGVKISLMETMRLHLMQTLPQCSLSHASRHVEFCKRVMSYAMEMEYVKNNPLQPIKAKRNKPKNIVYLELFEIDKFKGFAATDKQLQKVKDVAVFQMFTGLSYGDLQSYQIVDREGTQWIANRRNKNDTPYYIPLLPEAKEIHDRYNGKLPAVTNQNYNRLIKYIATVTGIQKRITTHVFRKTFATQMDQRGVSPKTLSTMLGNTVQVCEKHYVARSPKRMDNELQRLGITQNLQLINP